MKIEPGMKRVIHQVYARMDCEMCGQPATHCHTYLLENCRNNPRSKAYGRDDVRWCADAEAVTCAGCRIPDKEDVGLFWCSSFDGSKFPHMIHHWVTTKEEITA